MEKNIKKLLHEFNIINSMQWIKGVNNNLSSVGNTFESLLRKKADSEIFPDYFDIEIKCSQRFSNYPLKMFNKVFDGPKLFETNYITNTYGNTYEYSNKKYLFVNLVINKFVRVYEKYYFLLSLSKKDNRIIVDIFDLDYNLLDSAYIDFQSVYEHLILKMSNLALVYASKKEENGDKYFRYYSITFYKLKNFDTFIDLIQNGIVKLSIHCRALFSSDDFGKQKNKGINFSIEKNNISCLFNKILEYNADDQMIKINSDYYFNN